MRRRGPRRVLVGRLAAACCFLTLLSCGHSPLVPGGRLLVVVTSELGPESGKRVELPGAGLSLATDRNGSALFLVPAGPYVVRAYEIGRGGPGPAFVEQDVEVAWDHTSRVDFFDCMSCVTPAR